MTYQSGWYHGAAPFVPERREGLVILTGLGQSSLDPVARIFYGVRILFVSRGVMEISQKNVMSCLIRPLDADDRERVSQFITEHWGASMVIAHGVVYYPHDLPGFVAVQGDKWVGLVTYHIEGNSCEIVSLNSIRPSIGIGTALIEEVKKIARQSGCRRLWLITTNDNLNALRFYQKRGFALAAIHRNALEVSRKIKPEIPLVGMDGIPLRDEIELEMMLAGAT